MAKRKPNRRKRTARPMTPGLAPAPTRPVAAALPMQLPAAAAPAPVPVAAPQEPGPARPRQGSRFTHRDYSYVRRDVQRIIVLAVAIIIAIVVLSFFLP